MKRASDFGKLIKCRFNQRRLDPEARTDLEPACGAEIMIQITGPIAHSVGFVSVCITKSTNHSYPSQKHNLRHFQWNLSLHEKN